MPTESFQAILTGLIAVISTYVAYQQYRIRRDERSLVLYDRRLAVFKSAISIVDRIRAGNAITCEEALTWLTSVAEAQFLFGEEIQTVLESLFGAVYEYALDSEPSLNGGDYTGEAAEAALAVERYRTPLIEVFTPYLRPAGSPSRRKRRLTVKQVTELLPKSAEARIQEATPGNSEDDIPF